MIKFRFLGNLRGCLPGGEAELEGEWSLEGALRAIAGRHAPLRRALFAPGTEQIADYYCLIVNGQLVKFHEDGMGMPLRDGDVVQVFPPVSGG